MSRTVRVMAYVVVASALWIGGSRLASSQDQDDSRAEVGRFESPAFYRDMREDYDAAVRELVAVLKSAPQTGAENLARFEAVTTLGHMRAVDAVRPLIQRRVEVDIRWAEFAGREDTDIPDDPPALSALARIGQPVVDELLEQIEGFVRTRENGEPEREISSFRNRVRLLAALQGREEAERTLVRRLQMVDHRDKKGALALALDVMADVKYKRF